MRLQVASCVEKKLEGSAHVNRTKFPLMNSFCKQAKLDYQKNATKRYKQMVQNKAKKAKKKKPKATRKPKAKLIFSNPTISKTKTPIINCTCPANYTSFTIDSNIKCFKYGTKGPLSLAVSTCAKDGARPPLPKNAKENTDLLAYFSSKKNETHSEFALDLSKAQNESDFISSIGRKLNYTNWRTQKPENKSTVKEFVTMHSDGRWNIFDGNFTTDALVCQTDCQSCKYYLVSRSVKIITQNFLDFIESIP